MPPLLLALLLVVVVLLLLVLQVLAVITEAGSVTTVSRAISWRSPEAILGFSWDALVELLLG